MSVLVYLVPLALALGLTGLAAFLWSLRAGQYDDLEGSALRVLSDDDLGASATPPDRPEATVRSLSLLGKQRKISNVEVGAS